MLMLTTVANSRYVDKFLINNSMNYKKRIERIVMKMFQEGYNQSSLSEKASLCRQTLSKALNDKENQVNEKTLVRIEEVLNIAQ